LDFLPLKLAPLATDIRDNVRPRSITGTGSAKQINFFYGIHGGIFQSNLTVDFHTFLFKIKIGNQKPLNQK
jgi:hypothetical protein